MKVGGLKVGRDEDLSEYLIINGNQIYNSLILVIRPKFWGFLQVYSEIVREKINDIVS